MQVTALHRGKRSPADGRCAAWLAALAVLLGTAGGAFGLDEPPTWDPFETVFVGGGGQSISVDRHVGADRMLDFDNFGDPAIAYEATRTFTSPVPGAGAVSIRSINFARRVSGKWHSTASLDLDTDDLTPDNGEDRARAHPSLRFDRRERPHIVANANVVEDDEEVPRLIHAYGQHSFDNVVEDIDLAGVGQTHLSSGSLAIDREGQPVVGYHRFVQFTGPRGVVARDFDGDFLAFGDDVTQQSILDADPGVVPLDHSPTSLAVGPANQPHLGYVGDVGAPVEDHGQPRHATTLSGLGEMFSEPINDDAQTTQVSMAVNPATGQPAAAYADEVFGVLVYAELNAETGAWENQVIPGTTFASGSVSLAFDPTDDRPAIAYTDIGETARETGEIHLAWLDSDGLWQDQLVVDSIIGEDGVPSLAFNDAPVFGDSLPAIAYLTKNATLDGTNALSYIEDPIVIPEPMTMTLLGIGGLALGGGHRRRRVES